jgi:hypothetical protein
MVQEPQTVTPYAWFDPTRPDNAEGDWSIRAMPSDLEIEEPSEATPKVSSVQGSAIPSDLIPDLDLSPESPVDAGKESDLAAPADDLPL